MCAGAIFIQRKKIQFYTRILHENRIKKTDLMSGSQLSCNIFFPFYHFGTASIKLKKNSYIKLHTFGITSCGGRMEKKEEICTRLM